MKPLLDSVSPKQSSAPLDEFERNGSESSRGRRGPASLWPQCVARGRRQELGGLRCLSTITGRATARPLCLGSAAARPPGPCSRS